MKNTNPLALNPRSNNQRGAVLMGGVILLTLMTLIGLTSIKSSILEEKMAGNNREKHRSFESSEMTLSIADGHLTRQNDVLPFYAGTYSGAGAPTIDGLYKIDDNAGHQPWERSNNWKGGTNNSLTINNQDVPEALRFSDDELSQLNLDTNAPPRYMMGLAGEVELDGMDSSIPQKFFRFYLTAQAKGGVTTIKTTLQNEALRAY